MYLILVFYQIDGNELLRNAVPFSDAWPELELECLPNRNSLVYEKKYGLEHANTIFRGTLRYSGFSGIMNVMQKMGMFDPLPLGVSTWEDLLGMLKGESVHVGHVQDCWIHDGGSN